MSVQILSKTEEMTLRITNYDYTCLKNVIEKWGFKDVESLMRFVLSILLLREQAVVPARKFLRKEGIMICPLPNPINPPKKL